MKICVIHPGASSSVSDVHDGLLRGLKNLGHEVIQYNLLGRLARAGQWLDYCWKKARKAGQEMERPNIADLLYQAGGDAILRCLHHQPDWVIVVSGIYFPLKLLKLLKQANFRVGLLLTESPYDDTPQDKLASAVDVVWTNERSSVERLRISNPNTFYLPHAYDTAKHRIEAAEIDDTLPAHDVVFVGTCFQERIELLSAVDLEGIDFGLYGNWQALGSRSRLRKYLAEGEIDNHTTAALYRRAKMGLNLYRQSIGFGRNAPRIDSAESLNPRAYELAACGLFHLSDYRTEVEEILGDLVPTFTDADSLEKQIRRWLANDAGRREIAAKLPASVAGHTWDERAKVLTQNLEQLCEAQSVSWVAS